MAKFQPEHCFGVTDRASDPVQQRYRDAGAKPMRDACDGGSGDDNDIRAGLGEAFSRCNDEGVLCSLLEVSGPAREIDGFKCCQAFG